MAGLGKSPPDAGKGNGLFENGMETHGDAFPRI